MTNYISLFSKISWGCHLLRNLYERKYYYIKVVQTDLFTFLDLEYNNSRGNSRDSTNIFPKIMRLTQPIKFIPPRQNLGDVSYTFKDRL